MRSNADLSHIESQSEGFQSNSYARKCSKDIRRRGLPNVDNSDIDGWYENLDSEIEGLSTTILVHSTVKLDILV